MTTDELISALKTADPSGKMKVVILQYNSLEDKYFVPPLHEPEIREIDEGFLDLCCDSAGITNDDIGSKVVVI